MAGPQYYYKYNYFSSWDRGGSIKTEDTVWVLTSKKSWGKIRALSYQPHDPSQVI